MDQSYLRHVPNQWTCPINAWSALEAVLGRFSRESIEGQAPERDDLAGILSYPARAEHSLEPHGGPEYDRSIHSARRAPFPCPPATLNSHFLSPSAFAITAATAADSAATDGHPRFHPIQELSRPGPAQPGYDCQPAKARRFLGLSDGEARSAFTVVGSLGAAARQCAGWNKAGRPRGRPRGAKDRQPRARRSGREACSASAPYDDVAAGGDGCFEPLAAAAAASPGGDSGTSCAPQRLAPCAGGSGPPVAPGSEGGTGLAAGMAEDAAVAVRRREWGGRSKPWRVALSEADAVGIFGCATPPPSALSGGMCLGARLSRWVRSNRIAGTRRKRKLT